MECPDCRAPQTAARLQQEIAVNSGLLPGEMGLTLLNLYKRGEGSRAMLAEVRRMADCPYGMLTLWGGPGNGKTLALQVLVNVFMAHNQAAVYTRLADLLAYLMQGYDPSEPMKTHTRYKKISECKLLAIDEFDKAKLTDKAREWIFTLIDDRYRYGRETGLVQRHTVLAMNENPDTFPEYIVSRLRYDMDGPNGFRIVHNIDTDARPVGL